MLAALLFALHPVHVRMSHYAMPDILSVTLLAGGALAWLIYLNTGKTPPLIFSSISIGLSAASKYTPGLVAAGLVLWLAFHRQWKQAALFSSCLMAGFFLGAPYTILDLTGFVSRLSHLSEFFLIGSGETSNLPQRFIQTILFFALCFRFRHFGPRTYWRLARTGPMDTQYGTGHAFLYFMLGPVDGTRATLFFGFNTHPVSLGRSCFGLGVKRRPYHAQICGLGCAVYLSHDSGLAQLSISQINFTERYALDRLRMDSITPSA